MDRPLAALRAERDRLRAEVRRRMHTLQDVLDGRVAVGVEGRGGKDVDAAERAGLYVDRRYALFARDAASAAPVVAFLAAGGTYDAEFSRLLGYTPDEIATYAQFLAADRALLLREVGPLTPAQVNAMARLARSRERDWSLPKSTGGALVERGLADVETHAHAGRYGRAGTASRRARHRHYVEAGYALTDRGRAWLRAHAALGSGEAERRAKPNRVERDPGVPHAGPAHPYFAFTTGLRPLYHRTQGGAERAVVEALGRARGKLAQGVVGVTTWARGARTSRTLAAFRVEGEDVVRVELADLSKPNPSPTDPRIEETDSAVLPRVPVALRELPWFVGVVKGVASLRTNVEERTAKITARGSRAAHEESIRIVFDAPATRLLVGSKGRHSPLDAVYALAGRLSELEWTPGSRPDYVEFLFSTGSFYRAVAWMKSGRKFQVPVGVSLDFFVSTLAGTSFDVFVLPRLFARVCVLRDGQLAIVISTEKSGCEFNGVRTPFFNPGDAEYEALRDVPRIATFDDAHLGSWGLQVDTRGVATVYEFEEGEWRPYVTGSWTGREFRPEVALPPRVRRAVQRLVEALPAQSEAA